MAYSDRGIRFLCFFILVYGPCLSAHQFRVEQMKGIVGELFIFPVEFLDLHSYMDVFWMRGHVHSQSLIARIHKGKIVSVFEERFKTRLQLDNINSLRINGLESEDGGYYLVHKNMSSSFVKVFNLSVYNPVPAPHVQKINGSESLANRSCTLQCFVGNASEVNVSWIRDGKPLNTTELEISQEMQGDNVTCTCVASNPASNKTTTVTPSHYYDEKDKPPDSSHQQSDHHCDTPSHYCDKKGDGAGTHRSHYFYIAVMVIAGIVIAVMGVLAVRRENTATEEEGSNRMPSTNAIEYAEMNGEGPPGKSRPGNDRPVLGKQLRDGREPVTLLLHFRDVPYAQDKQQRSESVR